MRKALFCLFFSFVFLYGGTPEIPLTKEEQNYLKTHPVIYAHNESNWPPFNFNENGKAKGFAVEYMNLLAKKLGIEVKYISGYSWGEFIRLLHTDKLDVIINISITDERKQSMIFTQPYIKAKNAIYININGKPYSTLKQLDGKRIALVKDFFIQKYIMKHNPEIKQVLVPNLLKALELLSLGKVDAIVGKQVVVDYLMRENLISSVIAVDYLKNPDTVSRLTIAADKKDKMLIELLDKAQKSIKPQTFSRLKHKWFGINALLNTSELLTDEEKNYLKEKQAVQVCLRSSSPPLEFVKDNQPAGIAADVLDTITGKLGIKLKYRYTKSLDESYRLLRDGQCDIIPATSRSDAKTAFALFSDIYLSYKTALVTKKDKPEIKLLSTIGPKTVAGAKGDPVLEQLAGLHPDFVIMEKDTELEALKAVRQNRAYLAVVPFPIYKHYQKIMGWDDLKTAGYAPIKSQYGIAVRKNEPRLYTLLNKIIRATPKVAYKAISDRWTKETVIQKTSYTLLFEILGVALLVIAAVLLAYRKQQKLNREIEKLNQTLESKIEKVLEDNKKQQAYMLHQDRLARLGEMIAMIAHQWRQPLNNLSMVNHILISKYKKGKLSDGDIESFQSKSAKLIKQMSDTIDDFRDFYKPERKKELFCVEKIVEETVKLIEPSLKQNNIKLELFLDGCNHFDGYANELQHAVMNIINNAVEALIYTDTDNKKITLDIRKEGKDTIIRIKDNAGGIEPQMQEKIFEPYFSTKENKNGTGLGLYISRMIIVEHMQSELNFSNTDDGSEFVIILKG